MYAVPQREHLIGAGPRIIQFLYIPMDQPVTLDNMLRCGIISRSQYAFLSRRVIRMVYHENVYDVTVARSEKVYELWADLTQRDETAYALLSV